MNQPSYIVKQKDLEALLNQFSVKFTGCDKTILGYHQSAEQLIRILTPLETTIQVVNEKSEPVEWISKALSGKTIMDYMPNIQEWPENMQVSFNENPILKIEARVKFSKALEGIMKAPTPSKKRVPQTTTLPQQTSLSDTRQNYHPQPTPLPLLYPKPPGRNHEEMESAHTLLNLRSSR